VIASSFFWTEYLWMSYCCCQGPATAVAFSRSGEFFASGGSDEQVICASKHLFFEHTTSYSCLLMCYISCSILLLFFVAAHTLIQFSQVCVLYLFRNVVLYCWWLQQGGWVTGSVVKLNFSQDVVSLRGGNTVTKIPNYSRLHYLFNQFTLPELDRIPKASETVAAGNCDAAIGCNSICRKPVNKMFRYVPFSSISRKLLTQLTGQLSGSCWLNLDALTVSFM